MMFCKERFCTSHNGHSTLFWYHKFITEYFILQFKCTSSEYYRYTLQISRDSQEVMGKFNTQLFKNTCAFVYWKMFLAYS
jgi:hypothetical protein